MDRLVELIVPVKNEKDTHYEMVSIINKDKSVQVSKLSYVGSNYLEVFSHRQNRLVKKHWTIISLDSFDTSEQCEAVVKQLTVKYLSYERES